MDDAQFQQRFDLARMVLERKYRWAKRILRNLQPVRRDQGTLAVDKYLRLYHGPEADGWSDKEFVGALWHEVNHIMRHHPERLSHLPKKHQMDPVWVNVAADLEINDDLRDQGITLPQGVMYSEQYEHFKGLSAEEHFAQFVEDQEQEQQPQPGGDKEPQDGDDDDSGEQEGGTPGQGDQPGDEGKQNDGGDAGDGPPTPEATCGSGTGGESLPDELDAPEVEDQARVDREMRKAAEDVVNAVEENGGLLPGMGQEVHDAAVEFLGRSEHDWKQELAVEIRNAMEQRADEAEEYTFRRKSRRQDTLPDDLVIPGSYRPVPTLAVVVDVSGSMDQAKLTAAMREVHGILERLAIPTFKAYAFNRAHLGTTEVHGPGDIEHVFKRTGGGTDMQSGVNLAIAEGAEVVVVLTDNETRWDDRGPDGVPVIIGGIRRRKHHTVPTWCRVVDVDEKGEYDGYDY